jgi:hypothetical protein
LTFLSWCRIKKLSRLKKKKDKDGGLWVPVAAKRRGLFLSLDTPKGRFVFGPRGDDEKMGKSFSKKPN